MVGKVDAIGSGCSAGGLRARTPASGIPADRPPPCRACVGAPLACVGASLETAAVSAPASWTGESVCVTPTIGVAAAPALVPRPALSGKVLETAVVTGVTAAVVVVTASTTGATLSATPSTTGATVSAAVLTIGAAVIAASGRRVPRSALSS
jgi:hypothetical protein